MPMAGHLQMEVRVAQAQIVPQQVPEERPAVVAAHHSSSLVAARASLNPAVAAVVAHMFLRAIQQDQAPKPGQP